MKVVVRRLVLALLVIVAGCVTYTYRGQVYSWGRDLESVIGRSSAEASTPPELERYRTAVVRRGDISQTVSATGTLNAVVTVEVGTQLSGQLAKVFADFNQQVKKGEPLAELDRRSFEAKVAEARAGTEAAKTLVSVQKAKVERARVDVQDAEAKTAVLQARVESARARNDAAEKATKRTSALYSRAISSSKEFEQAEADRDVAAAGLREAQALAAANVHTIAAARADLQRADAELENALAGVPQREATQLLTEIDLEKTIIRAPIDGIVVGKAFSEGQTVAASLEAPTLFTLAGDLESMDIHARVDETDIGRIKVGQKATFNVDAHPGRQFDAEVIAVRKAPQQQQPGSVLRRTPAAPSNVVSYTVILRTSNPAALLLPGMTAVVRIIVDEARNVLNVPMAALRFHPQSETRDAGALPQVWVWDAGRKRLRSVPVEIGTTDGTRGAILSKEGRQGLSEGDQVVVAEAVEAAPQQSFGFKLGL